VESRRAESFSDGVFAVAITVLVFNLLPIARPNLTFRYLGSYWPQYAAYVVSFLTIGIMWLNHHTLLSYVARVNRITLVLNTFLLLGVVAVPFPTALIAESLGPQGTARSAQVATVVYGLVLIAISIAFSGLWVYLQAHQDILAARAISAPVSATVRFAAGLVGYIVATLIAAFVSPEAALVLYGLIAVYYLFEHLPDSDPQAGAANAHAAGGDAAGGAVTGRDPAGS